MFKAVIKGSIVAATGLVAMAATAAPSSWIQIPPPPAPSKAKSWIQIPPPPAPAKAKSWIQIPPPPVAS